MKRDEFAAWFPVLVLAAGIGLTVGLALGATWPA